ncbi:MAG: hypothetical protein N2170_07765, partial [Bacteroidia bacterium]|nr:hypothetical protein [Bacteroidia bacterium]
MLPNMTCGQNPFEIRWLAAEGFCQLWLFFSPAAYIQGEVNCYARYEVEVIFRDSLQIYHRIVRTLSLSSTPDEIPLCPNHFSWETHLSTSTLTWEILVWDTERRISFYRKGPPSPNPESRIVSFFLTGNGADPALLTSRQSCLYRFPPGLYLGQAALYKGEASLPELTRYLSIEERRFTLEATGKIDTLYLSWRTEELPSGRYLLG